MGKPWQLSCKEPTFNAPDCLQWKRLGFDPWVGKIPWRRKWQPTPIFLPRKSHWQSRLVGDSLWSCKSQTWTTWWLNHHNHRHHSYLGFPGSTVVQNLPANSGDTEMQVRSWVRKIPWSRKWQSPSVFLLGKFHGQTSLEGYNLWCCKRAGQDFVTKTTTNNSYICKFATLNYPNRAT